MGLLDRVRKDDPPDVEAGPPVEADQRARSIQLLVLPDALDDLVAAMRADATQRCRSA